MRKLGIQSKPFEVMWSCLPFFECFSIPLVQNTTTTSISNHIGEKTARRDLLRFPD